MISIFFFYFCYWIEKLRINSAFFSFLFAWSQTEIWVRDYAVRESPGNKVDSRLQISWFRTSSELFQTLCETLFSSFWLWNKRFISPFFFYGKNFCRPKTGVVWIVSCIKSLQKSYCKPEVDLHLFVSLRVAVYWNLSIDLLYSIEEIQTEHSIPKHRFEPKCSSKVQARCQLDSHPSCFFFHRRELFKALFCEMIIWLTLFYFFAIYNHNKENNIRR